MMHNNCRIFNIAMARKYFAEIVINKEKSIDDKDIFIAHCPSLGVLIQGETIDEAMKNIKEAIDLYLEEQPEKFNELVSGEIPFFSVVEVTKNTKIIKA